jgi:ADP-L-glycero-D-manno-heptose 6-epimerase
LWLLQHEDVSGLFNVGSGRARSFEDLAKALFAALGRAPEIEYIDMPESIRDRYQYYTEARMTRLRDAGFDQPPTSLEAGVANYVRDYLTQEDPYR